MFEVMGTDKAKELSPEMARAVGFMAGVGGKIYRHPGGFWGPESVYARSYCMKAFGTKTVHALVTRGVAGYTKWKDGRNGQFPIEATLIRSHTIRSESDLDER